VAFTSAFFSGLLLLFIWPKVVDVDFLLFDFCAVLFEFGVERANVEHLAVIAFAFGLILSPCKRLSLNTQ